MLEDYCKDCGNMSLVLQWMNDYHRDHIVYLICKLCSGLTVNKHMNHRELCEYRYCIQRSEYVKKNRDKIEIEIGKIK